MKRKFDLFDKNFDNCTQISNFDLNFDFWQKYRFWKKKSIFSQKLRLWKTFRFWQKIRKFSMFWKISIRGKKILRNIYPRFCFNHIIVWDEMSSRRLHLWRIFEQGGHCDFIYIFKIFIIQIRKKFFVKSVVKMAPFVASTILQSSTVSFCIQNDS